MVRYDSYKDSGVEWLGDIPSHWDKIKLKYKGDVIIGLSYKPDDVVNENEGTLVMRSSNIQNGKPNFDDNVYVKTEISDKLTTKEGDILICSRNGSRRLIGKNCLITKDIEGMTWGVFMTMYRSPYSKYMYWLLNSPIFKSQSGLFLTSTINQLTVSTLENMVLPFTENIDEQQQIVSFLDTKTSLIDSLIEKTQRKIELLKEKRTSLINEVVTKGLNPNVEMKDSGVEWIGEIPIHWETGKLKNNSDLKISSIDKHIIEEEIQVIVCNYTDVYYNEFITSELPLRKGSCSENEYSNFILKRGDVIITKDSESPTDIGVPSLVKENLDNVVCGYHLSIIKSNPKKLVGGYLFRQLQTNRIRSYFEINSNGITRFGLGKSSVLETPLILPPTSEQQQIVEYLDEQTQLIDNTISIEEKRIELLKEYRQSLISEVVTGKRKVV